MCKKTTAIECTTRNSDAFCLCIPLIVGGNYIQIGGVGIDHLLSYFVLCSPNQQSPISRNKIKSKRLEIGWGGLPPPEDQRTAP